MGAVTLGNFFPEYTSSFARSQLFLKQPKPPPLTFIVIVVHRRRTWKENTPNLYNFPILSFQNILDKFNPGARQLISAGKAYLKALHGKKMLTVVFIYLTTYLPPLLILVASLSCYQQQSWPTLL